MSFSPINNLRAIPLPQIGLIGLGSISTIPAKGLRAVPLPQFNPYVWGNLNKPWGWPPGGFIPIKPLPGTGGGGGGATTVGYGI